MQKFCGQIHETPEWSELEHIYKNLLINGAFIGIKGAYLGTPSFAILRETCRHSLVISRARSA